MGFVIRSVLEKDQIVLGGRVPILEQLASVAGLIALVDEIDILLNCERSQ